jgi:hypothetical protein
LEESNVLATSKLNGFHQILRLTGNPLIKALSRRSSFNTADFGFNICSENTSSDKDPNKDVTLLKAIQWIRIAWNDAVTRECIEKCFWKSTVFKKPANQEVIVMEDSEREQRAELEAQMIALPVVTDPLSIGEFLEPLLEVIDDDNGEIFTFVVERYSADREGEEEPMEEGDIEVERVPVKEAIKALETLNLWEIQQENGEISALQTLEQIVRRIQQHKLDSAKQTTLDSFFLYR